MALDHMLFGLGIEIVDLIPHDQYLQVHAAILTEHDFDGTHSTGQYTERVCGRQGRWPTKGGVREAIASHQPRLQIISLTADPCRGDNIETFANQ